VQNAVVPAYFAQTNVAGTNDNVLSQGPEPS